MLMNGNSLKVLWGIISIMFVALFALISVAWSDMNGDIAEVKASVKEIQREYYRIQYLERDIAALASKVDDLLDRSFFE